MSKLWVGQGEGGTMLWVYDPEVVHIDPDMLYLYNVKTRLMKGYEKRIARSFLTKTIGSMADQACLEYQNWRATPEAEDFIRNDEEAFLQKRQNDIEKAKLKHAEYLKLHGKDNKGTSFSTKEPRVTHCYACKQALKSGLFLECNSCFWLICYCGACGCGYIGKSNDDQS